MAAAADDNAYAAAAAAPAGGGGAADAAAYNDPVMAIVVESRLMLIMRMAAISIIFSLFISIPAAYLGANWNEDPDTRTRTWLMVAFLLYAWNWLTLMIVHSIVWWLHQARNDAEAEIAKQRLRQIVMLNGAVSLFMLAWLIYGWVLYSNVSIGTQRQLILAYLVCSIFFNMILMCGTALITRVLALVCWPCRNALRRRLILAAAAYVAQRRPGRTYAAHELPSRPVNQLTDASDSCPICLSEFVDTVTDLPCKHKFHKDCIRPWLEKNNTCPCCRAVPRFDQSAGAEGSAAPAAPAAAARAEGAPAQPRSFQSVVDDDQSLDVV